MQRTDWFVIIAMLGLIFGFAGCGKTADSTPGSKKVAADTTTPDKAVFAFLEAVRTGDDEQAADLLTPTARKKTAEMEMVVAPPGSDTARFQVGGVETPDQNIAHVGSHWTDLDHTGKPRTDQITWILRQEPEGWRIAGMATQLFPDSAPLHLNFEDPEDMLRKQQAAEEEFMRREGQVQQAQQSQGGVEAQRK